MASRRTGAGFDPPTLRFSGLKPAPLDDASLLPFPLHLSQHADEHRPERPILLAVDQ
jgi:hypothetical protein